MLFSDIGHSSRHQPIENVANLSIWRIFTLTLLRRYNRKFRSVRGSCGA